MSATIESLLDLDSLLSAEDIELRAMVRQFGEQRLRPHVAEWFQSGEVPVRDLAVEIGKLAVIRHAFGGAARNCLQTALDYVGTRKVLDKPLAAYQLTQAALADMAVELGKAQLLALHLGRLKDDGRSRSALAS